MDAYKSQYRIQLYTLQLLLLASLALGNLASNLSCTSNCSCKHGSEYGRTFFRVECRENSDVDEEELSERLNLLLPLYNNLTHGGLEWLTIVNTPLKYVPRSVCHLTTLKYLELNNNQLTGLPDDCFPHVKHLKSLTAAGNKIEKLQDGLFDRLSYMLASLYISRNHISEIGPRSICHLTILEQLDLDNNQLTRLPDDCFPHLRRLRFLSFTGNKIESLQDGLFDGLRELYHLNFSRNRISEIGLRVFSSDIDMTSLRYIDLSHNKLKNIEPWPLIRGLHVLQYTVMVDLRYNRISTATNNMGLQWPINCDETPHGIYRYVNVQLGWNKIRHIMDIKEGWNFTFPQLYCLLDHSFVTIYFEANPFTCDCIDYPMYAFINEARSLIYDPLVNCYCSPVDSPFPNTLVKKVPLDQFVCNLTEHCPPGCRCVHRPANSTLHVDCSSANISILPFELPELPDSHTKYKLDFSNNRYLQRLDHRPYFINTSILDVNNCGIEELPLSVWKDMSAMKKVSMDGNSLTSLPPGVETVPLTASMNFGRNPWECSCENRWMSGWLRSFNHSTESIYGFLCASPTRLIGKSIAKISEEEFCHDPASAERKRALITNVASVTGVAVFLLIPMIIIFIVYRLRIKLYTRFKFHPFDRDECAGEDMDFDVFLSCCSDDNLPHGNGIREQLEERGYRVCYPPRDFVPGEAICQNIYNAVVRSKRTVCLLTPHFLQRLDHYNYKTA